MITNQQKLKWDDIKITLVPPYISTSSHLSALTTFIEESLKKATHVPGSVRYKGPSADTVELSLSYIIKAPQITYVQANTIIP